MPEYTLRAGGQEMFRNLVIHVPTGVSRFVRAWQFRPGDRLVPHATMQIDTDGTSRRYDDQDAESGYEGLMPSARAPDGFFLDWAPGNQPQSQIPSTASPLPKDSDLVMMLHLRPSGKVKKYRRQSVCISGQPARAAAGDAAPDAADFGYPGGRVRLPRDRSFTLPMGVICIHFNRTRITCA